MVSSLMTVGAQAKQSMQGMGCVRNTSNEGLINALGYQLALGIINRFHQTLLGLACGCRHCNGQWGLMDRLQG